MKLTADSIKTSLQHYGQVLRHYSVLLFLLFLLSIYGYLGWRIVSLNQQQPDEAAVATKLKTAGVPHINQDVLNKVQQLQDNSVGVQTLFDDARSSPFQE